MSFSKISPILNPLFPLTWCWYTFSFYTWLLNLAKYLSLLFLTHQMLCLRAQRCGTVVLDTWMFCVRVDFPGSFVSVLLNVFNNEYSEQHSVQWEGGTRFSPRTPAMPIPRASPCAFVPELYSHIPKWKCDAICLQFSFLKVPQVLSSLSLCGLCLSIMCPTPIFSK